MVEILLKIYVFRLEMLKSKMEMFDATVVTVSWILDIVFFKDSSEAVLGLIIFLRLWRIMRIAHGFALSMVTPLEHKLSGEKEARMEKERELADERDYTKSLEGEIAQLRQLCMTSDAQIPVNALPETKVRQRDVSK